MKTLPAFLDVAPWNNPAGVDFLMVFFVMGSVLIMLALTCQAIMNSVLDDRRSHLWRGGASGHAGGPVATSAAGLLRPRQLPDQGGVWRLAFLNGKTKGLADALMGYAGSAGWWTAPKDSTETSTWTIHADKLETTDPVLATFARRLRTRALTANELRDHAMAAAEHWSETFDADLARLALHRDATQRQLHLMVAAVTTALLCGAVVLRLWARSYVSPHAPFPLNLLMVLAVMLVFLWLATVRSLTQSRHGRAHLDWLRNATLALGVDVKSGRRTAPRDVSLMAALSGLSALGATAGFDALHRIITPSSSGSCSSGGGCGGGCGGGGGCS